MITLRAALAASIALAPLPALARSQSQQPAAAAAVAVKPLAYTERTLPNGLRVYAIRDTTTSNVAVQVWYDVGSKDDPKGRSGFAHMFEHLMFKATRNLVNEQMDRLTEDVGGYNNASTDDDYTNYFEVVPANHLERLLFAEADRMASLVVDPAVFASEREVVKEELRSRVLAQPYGKLFYLNLPAVSYSVHPYARSGIGSIEDLDAATVEDIRAFHATYYRPDNAILVVAGNFDPAQLDKWVDRYFGPIKRPDRPIPRVTVKEPERTKPVTYTVYEANTPLPAVLMSFPIPPDNHPDSAALTVLNTVLSGGRNSRLYQALVYRDQVAQAADTYLNSKQGTGALAIYAILAGGKTAEQGEAALRREIAALRARPITDAELREAKNEIVTAALRSRETAEGKAFTLAQAVIINGDPRAADRQLAEIGRVTAADVQRAAAIYLADHRAATIRYLPAEAAPAGAKGDKITVAATVQATPLVPPADIPVITPAPEGQRVLPPPPGPPVKPNLPQPRETRLANGLRLIVVEKRDLPLVAASLVTLGGGALDPNGRAGLAEMTAELLTKGTRNRSATEIASAVESLGGTIDSGAEWDGAAVSVSVKSDQVEPALGILADVARNPAFAQEELERARTQTIDGLSVQLKDPGALSGMVAARVVFGSGPYGHLLTGTPDTLKAISRDDVTGAYAATWRPDRAALVLVGDIGETEARALAERLFGDWRGSGAAAPAVATAQAFPPPRVVVVDLPEAGQAGVVVARPGIARSDPTFYPASVANAALGVGFTSRLNQEIRIKRGLAYGAGSSLDARRGIGPFMAQTQTKNPSAPEVVSLILAEMRRLGTEPASAAELDTRKAVLIGSFGRRIETTGGLAGILGDYVVEDVPLTELDRYIPSLQGVTPEAVRRAAARLLDPTAASIVVVGDAKSFVDELRRTYPKLELIPASELDLDTPALK